METLSVAYISQGPLAAEVAKSKLEAYGIPVVLRYASVGRVLGLTVDGLGRVEVLVPTDRLDEAQTLLASAGLGDTPDMDAP